MLEPPYFKQPHAEEGGCDPEQKMGAGSVGPCAASLCPPSGSGGGEDTRKPRAAFRLWQGLVLPPVLSKKEVQSLDVDSCQGPF